MGKGEQSGSMDGVFKQGYGLIPKLVMRDKDLSPEAKAIYAYLASFTGAGLTAYPSISLMTTELNMSENRFYSHRKQLISKGYISISKKRSKEGWSNNIYTLVTKPHLQFEGIQNEGIQNEGIQNEGTIINSSIINSSITNSNRYSPAKAEQPPFEEIIGYLNERADRNFKHTTRKTRSLINARVNEGFNVDDFKRVIDTKVSEWKKDSSMDRYLRPETLFGTKFEGYLNQDPPNSTGYDPNKDAF